MSRPLFFVLLCCLGWWPGRSLAQLAQATQAAPAEPAALSPTLDGYEYPHLVQYLPLRIEGLPVRMAYMDVPAAGPANGRTVLLLHGKNFFGAYWQGTVAALSQAGYRVVVPDQIGFGKSDKPNLHYSFHQLARNTKQLLDSLRVKKVVVVGHSMGGMLAARFALEFPAATERLVLENPIGLEDYRLHVPYQTLLESTTNEMKTSEESLRAYHATYYPGGYPRAHDRWLLPLAAQTRHPDFATVAVANALTYDMIYQQPVLYEFDQLRTPTLLIIGQQDRTAVGKALVQDPAVLATLGQYPVLGKRTKAKIKGSKLVALENVGHIPHLEAPEQFHAALLAFLR